MTKRIIAYVIYHDDASKQIAEEIAQVRPWFVPIFIKTGKYMESEVFALLETREEEWKDADFVAILKYSFRDKTPFYDFEAVVNTFGDHADILTFVNGHEPPLHDIPMIITAAYYHPIFHVIWFHLLSHFNIPHHLMFCIKMPAFYSNYWIARTRMFKEYLMFFSQARKLMDENKLLKKLLYDDAIYIKRYTPEKYTEIAGVPYQTYHCFIAERLACFFFYAIGANICMIGQNRNIDPSIPVLA